MDWDTIVSYVFSAVAKYLLGRLIDSAVSYWLNSRNK